MRSTVMRSTIVIVSVVALAACGSSNGNDTRASGSVDGAEVAVGVAPRPSGASGSLRDAVEVAAGAPGQASDAACALDRRTLEAAVEAYELLNGALPTSQQELLEAQVIRELSIRFEVDAAGAVIPAPAGPCA